MQDHTESGEVVPEKPAWGSFWALIGMQTQNSFTVSIVKFLLIPLGAWLVAQDMGGGLAGHAEHVVSLLLVLPYLMFSPLAGWIADRLSKSVVIKTAAWVQWGIVLLFTFAVAIRSLELCFVCFFLYSLQCCLLSPAKLGVVKELVGSQRLAFATGVVEGTVILAILAGQISGGVLFVHLTKTMSGWEALKYAMLWIAGFSLVGAIIAQCVRGTKSHSKVAFSVPMLFSHIKESKVVWQDKDLRAAAWCTAFFWSFAGFVNLIVIEIAKNTVPANELGTAISKLMLFASVGIALGSIFAGMLSKKGIEWSLAPIGLILMSGGLFVLATLPIDSPLLPYLLAFSGAGAAIFLVPVNAFVQDHPPADKRGTVISVSNFFNNLGGIAAVLLQLGMVMLGWKVQWQFLLLGCLTAVIAVWSVKKWTAPLLRVMVLPLVRMIYRIRIVGKEHLPKEGGVLLLPNHVTWADSFFISAACDRPVRFVMYDGFMKTKGVGWFARMFETVPISASRAKDAIRVVADALEQGSVVCLFAEGELTRTGCLMEIKRGFELMARKAGAPVVPLWMDGAWGSIFSFERGRFFKKKPYAVPYGMTFVFAPPQDGAAATTETVRCALQRASSVALDERGKRRGLADRTSFNGFQLGQILAIPRGAEFAMWGDDPACGKLAAFDKGFIRVFGGAVKRTEIDVKQETIRIGGKSTRELLEKANSAAAGVFYDFEPQHGWHKDGITYCPCLEIDGVVVAMSMPDPVSGSATSMKQDGRKEGSVGRLLPGIAVDGLVLSGPTLLAGGVAFPEGARIDEDGFVYLP